MQFQLLLSNVFLLKHPYLKLIMNTFIQDLFSGNLPVNQFWCVQLTDPIYLASVYWGAEWQLVYVWETLQVNSLRFLCICELSADWHVERSERKGTHGLKTFIVIMMPWIFIKFARWIESRRQGHAHAHKNTNIDFSGTIFYSVLRWKNKQYDAVS